MILSTNHKPNQNFKNNFMEIHMLNKTKNKEFKKTLENSLNSKEIVKFNKEKQKTQITIKIRQINNWLISTLNIRINHRNIMKTFKVIMNCAENQ